jgi:hypothetical protein
MAGRSTVRAALATVEAADAAASLVDLPGLLRPEPMTAFGADSALWTELDKTAGPLAHCPAGSSLTPSRCSTMRQREPLSSTRQASR